MFIDKAFSISKSFDFIQVLALFRIQIALNAIYMPSKPSFICITPEKISPIKSRTLEIPSKRLRIMFLKSGLAALPRAALENIFDGGPKRIYFLRNFLVNYFESSIGQTFRKMDGDEDPDHTG